MSNQESSEPSLVRPALDSALPTSAALPSAAQPAREPSATHAAQTPAIPAAAVPKPRAEPQSRYALLNGVRFHYLDWGNDAAHPLILLHGYTSHAHSWDTFARAMQDRYHVLALDQRGHGESGWTHDYSPNAMIDDIRAFTHALRLPKFSLLGLSMGGRNAYGFAAAHPDKVDRLVIVDIGPDLMPAGRTRIRSGVVAADVFDSPDEAFKVQRAANPRANETELHRRVAHNLLRTEDGRWTWRYDKALRSPENPLPSPAPDAAWMWLTRITCSTLLVRGAESDVLGADTAARMVRVMPHATLVTVPAAGHSVPLDNPTGFSDVVQPFLRSA